MHRPSMIEILKNDESYYSLVLAVAKRARDIVDEADLNGEIIEEKPVALAIEEFSKHQCSLMEPTNIGDDIE